MWLVNLKHKYDVRHYILLCTTISECRFISNLP
jgi:hypothetical protein